MASVFVAALSLALIASPHVVRAYDLTGVGGSLGYANPEDLDGTAALGVHAVLEKPKTHLHLDPSLRYWNVDGVRDLAPNMDATYHFRPESQWTPYVGGGLGLNFVHVRRSFDRSSTDLGLNMIGGVRFPGAANRYFVEGRYTASDINQVSLVTGITFNRP
jgi:opacity protein-like surface antigen